MTTTATVTLGQAASSMALSGAQKFTALGSVTQGATTANIISGTVVTAAVLMSAGASLTATALSTNPWLVDEHTNDSKKLTADSLVDLFKIILNDGVSCLYLHSGASITWQGNVWEGIGLKMAGVMNGSDEEVSRPTLNIMNPNGYFSAYIAGGSLNSATIIRYRVLGTNITNNLPIYLQQSWKMMRVMSLTRSAIQLQLREDIDGPVFTIPARLFLMPDFPSVSL